MKEVAFSLSQRNQLMANAKKLESEMLNMSPTASDPVKCENGQPKEAPTAPSPGAMPSPAQIPPPKPVAIKTSPAKQTPNTTSPRKRQEGGNRSRANKEKLQENAVETFDSRLKSIITNALIGESTGCSAGSGSTLTHPNSAPNSTECQMSALRSRLDASLGVPAQSKGILTGGSSSNRESLNLHQVLAAGPDRHHMLPLGPPGHHMEYMHMSPAKMALKKHFSQDPSKPDGPHPDMAQQGKLPPCSTASSNAGNGSLSLPVKIPLNEVSTNSSSKSLPVSLPLANNLPPNLPHAPGGPDGGGGVVEGGPHHQHHQRHHHRGSHHKAEEAGKGGRCSSPVVRDVYSPISRPSSSSSTASAESVRHLSHGAHCASPRSNSSYNMDNSMLSENSRSPGRAGQPTPPFSAASLAIHSKDPAFTQAMLMQHAKQSAVAAAASFPGYPQMASLLGMNMERSLQQRFGLPGGSREAKEAVAAAAAAAAAAGFPPQLSPGSSKPPPQPHPSQHPPHTAAAMNSLGYGRSTTPPTSQAYYRYPPVVNGLPKAAAAMTASPAEDKPRRGRRKRQKSPVTLPPSKKAAPTPPPHIDDGSPPKKDKESPVSAAVNRGAGAKPGVPNTPDIATMVSNATKPLAITAISDPESSAKSSPLDTSPAKTPATGPPQREVPGEHTSLSHSVP